MPRWTWVVLAALTACTGRGAVDAVQGREVTPFAPIAAAAPAPSAAPSATASSPVTAVAAPVDPTPPPPPVPELPLGGREIFPTYRLVGFCGTPGAPALGQLQGNLAARTKAMAAYAAKFPDDRKPLLTFELIAVVVQSWEGSDKQFRRRIDEKIIDDYLKATRAAKGILLLNVQPGRSDFMTEVKRFEKYLKEPDVGVALDPEWAVKAKQTPGVFYGQATGAQISEVAQYLASIVKENNLPEKVLVFHQLNKYVVKDEQDVVVPPGVVIIKSVDGLGPKHAKLVTYDSLIKTLPTGVHAGFKLFLDEDKRIGGHVMGPSEVMALKPQPEYVMVE